MKGNLARTFEAARALRVSGWSLRTLIGLQLLFAACASSVLIYRATGRAPEIIHFGWLSYRAWNIYLSLLLIAYFVWALRRALPYTVPLLAAFCLFHLVDGLLIGFWTKAVLRALSLTVLAGVAYTQALRRSSALERS